MIFSIFIRLALLTACIYVGLAFIGQVCFILFARFIAPIGIAHNRFGLGVLFGLTWLFAFNLAWWILRRNL